MTDILANVVWALLVAILALTAWDAFGGTLW